MRSTRALFACLIAACSAVPLAPVARAAEVECPSTYWSNFVNALVPPLDAGHYVTADAETITVRGDNALALVERYRAATTSFLTCLANDVEGAAAPYVDCVTERSAPILTSPDPVARYVEVGSDLVIRIHHGTALEDVRVIFNCNGVVRYGD